MAHECVATAIICGSGLLLARKFDLYQAMKIVARAYCFDGTGFDVAAASILF